MRDSRHSTRQRSPARSATSHRDLAAWMPYPVVALLRLVTLVVFWQVQSATFVLWDDGLHVYENPYFQNLTFENILAFWREPYAELYIPLTYTLWALVAAVAWGEGVKPTGGA